MIAQMLAGHFDAADVLFFIALIVFAVAGLYAALQRADPTHGALIPFGLALLAAGLWVT